ncbi:MAG: hypothetical protein RL684_3149 [Pseudomonadota bacterium]
MEHHVVKSRLRELYPTQMTLGVIEVAWKRKEWEGFSRRRRSELLRDHVVPCVIGPKGRRFVIDHHHLCVALHAEGVKQVWTHALSDLSWLDDETFWRTLEYRRWVHPYDAKGRRRDYDEIPRSFSGLKDDPYRSLAALVRRSGGFAKDTLPFAEFQWADFFRAIVRMNSGQPIGGSALREAMKAARSTKARYLPGWIESDD